jgi:hypothetical protein
LLRHLGPAGTGRQGFCWFFCNFFPPLQIAVLFFQLSELGHLGASATVLLAWAVADLDSSDRADAGNALSVLARLALAVDNHALLADLSVGCGLHRIRHSQCSGQDLTLRLVIRQALSPDTQIQSAALEVLCVIKRQFSFHSFFHNRQNIHTAAWNRYQFSQIKALAARLIAVPGFVTLTVNFLSFSLDNLDDLRALLCTFTK